MKLQKNVGLHNSQRCSTPSCYGTAFDGQWGLSIEDTAKKKGTLYNTTFITGLRDL